MAYKFWTTNALNSNSVNTSQTKVHNDNGTWTITEAFVTIVSDVDIAIYTESLQSQVTFLQTGDGPTIDALNTEIASFPGTNP